MQSITCKPLLSPDCENGGTDRAEDEAEPECVSALLLQVINRLPQAISWKDHNAVYLGCNQAFAAAVGLIDPNDIIGKPETEVCWQNAPIALLHDRGLIEQNRAEYHQRLPIAGTEGNTWLDVSKIPLHDSDGNVIGIVSTIDSSMSHVLETHIAERTQAEAAARESEARLRSLVENLPFDFWACDIDGRYTMQNSADIQHWGNLMGRHSDDVELPTNLLRVSPDLKARALAGEVVRTERRYEKGDEFRICSTFMAPVRDEDEICGLLGVNIDITEQKLAEESLREQARRERLLNRLIRQIRNSLDFDTILSTTLQQVRDAVQADRCQFAWYRDEGVPVWQVLQESRYADLPDRLGTYPAAMLEPLSETLLQLKSLRVSNAEATREPILQALGFKSLLVIPLRTQSGAIGVIACSHSSEVRDWSNGETELLKAVSGQLAIALNQADLYAQSRSKAQELEVALRELQWTQTQMIQNEKMSSLGQLVAGVAHEINNPVNFIYGNLIYANSYATDLLHLIQCYQQHYPNPVPELQQEMEAIDLGFLIQDLPKLLASMRGGAERIQQIVVSLRNFSRVDEAEVKSVDIHEGIDSTLTILQNRLKPKAGNAPIDLITEYDNLPNVECYPGELNQVFLNILSNAIDAIADAAPALPTIWIRTERLGADRVVVKISDNGCGIPEAERLRLFDPFFTTKPVGKGTGLGLAISYQIVVDRHQGQLSCSSVPGAGTEFIVEIPIRRS